MAYTPFKFPQRTAPNQTFPTTPGYFGQLNMPVPTGPATGYNPRGMLPLATPNANAMPKNQKAAIIMGALSDIFRGQDPTQNTVVRQQQMVAMDAQRKAQERYDAAFAAANPQMQKIMAGYTAPEWQTIQGQLDLHNLKQTGAYAGTSMDAQYLNDLEIGAVDPEFQKTSRYKVAYQEMHAPSTYINAAGESVTRPGLRPGTYPNPFGDDESGTGEVFGIGAERRKLLKTDLDTVERVRNAIGGLRESINRINPSPLTVGTDLAEIDGKYNDLLLVLKDYAKLGVLAGPDLDLLNNWVGDPTSIKQLLKGGDQGTLVQLKSLEDAVRRSEITAKKELGEDIEEAPSQNKNNIAYLNGQAIVPNAQGTGWVYKDTGEPVNQ
ncbi:MAG: hypothetical protein Tp1111DCM298921_45 [Prokaryotic dsDNA virus sp.]|nr:MAG: hypothetical protein Tp1111DCM298921_45 [Prokaryotic dsDNA virus sp.]|tara:strand:+ start:31434 stop:32573 length:1140 start_codon:yes stop_codon:yes gene_type:complete